jgi:hypothetical protein
MTNSNEQYLRAAHTALDGLVDTPEDGFDNPLSRDEAADCFVAACLKFIQDATDGDGDTFVEAMIEIALIGAEMATKLKGEDGQTPVAFV